jgi:cell division septation protein DedD
MRDRSASVTTDQDQEFEMVLGNKQLFSLLFIVFVLLGIFFAMGYVMGRNSGPLETAGHTNAPVRGESESPAVQRPSPTEESQVSRPVPEAEAPAASKPAPAVVDTLPITITEPRPGQTFLQVSAVSKPDAELLVEVLNKRGFHSIVAPGPNETIFRVLVGPSPNDAELSKTRAALEQAGFKSIPKRY